MHGLGIYTHSLVHVGSVHSTHPEDVTWCQKWSLVMENLKPPDDLDLNGANKAEAWRQFKQAFEYYVAASGLGEKDNATQTAVFMHVAGKEAQRVLKTFVFDSDDDRKKLEKVQEKFKDYCLPKANVTMERHLLFTRKQKEGEGFEEFLVELRDMAARCELPATADSILRDCVILGIRDEKLRTELLRRNEDLEKVLSACRCAAATQRHLEQLKTPQQNSTADIHAAAVDGIVQKQPEHKTSRPLVEDCRYCGRSHRSGACPAYGKSCASCGKTGHFAQVCRSKARQQRIRTLEHLPEPSQGQKQFDTVNINSVESQKWQETLMLDGVPTVFKLDTGAMASVLPLSKYHEVRPHQQPNRTETVLTGFNGSTVRPEGTTTIATTYKKTTIPVKYYVSNMAANAIQQAAATPEVFGRFQRPRDLRRRISHPHQPGC